MARRIRLRIRLQEGKPLRPDGKGIARVVQQDRTGCGIACVAAIARAPYSRVRRMACRHFGWRMEGVFYTRSHHLIHLLENLGCATGRSRTVRRWESLPDLAIAAVNPDSENFNWHWVVFVREGGGAYVIDPRSKRERRTDFGRMRLRSCIPVSVSAWTELHG